MTNSTSSADSAALKPCPFCGSCDLDAATRGKRYVSCNSCGCFGGSPEYKGMQGIWTQWEIVEAEINEAWNRRALAVEEPKP